MMKPSGVRTMEHSYEHDYSSKIGLNSVLAPQDEEEMVLRELLVAFPGFSLEAIAAAYTEADADVDAAAEILAVKQPVVEVVHRTGLQGGRDCPTPTTGGNCRGIQPPEDAFIESDDLLLLRYGAGVGECISQIANQQGGILGKDANLENKNTHLLTGATSNGTSSRSGSIGGKEVIPGIGKKRKKKRRVGAEPEELEPKDAAARRAVEEFLLSMLGEGFQLGQDVVRDVLGYFEGDTQKSMEMLLHLASSTTGHGSESDKNATELKSPSVIVDAELDVIEDTLCILTRAFPNVDPAQVVMAFQEHNGDVEKISNALLLDGQVAPKLHGHQEALSKEVDCNHFDSRAIHAQLKQLFPLVDSNVLWEVLQSTNFILRSAHHVLLDAGLIPTFELPEHSVPSEVDQHKLSPTFMKNLHKSSGKEAITVEPGLQQGVWVTVKPVASPGRKKSTKESASSYKDAGKKKIAAKTQTHGKIGDLDDYDCHRQCAKENWSTMQTYFREAASAYCRGDRSYATVLSEKGKYYKQLAQEADERASQRIFASRNKNIENNITIDLHAQHVPEAIQVLKLHLRSLSRILSVHTLTVITGYGSHSSNGRGKIKPAVIHFLSKRGIPWKESNIGCLIIMLKDARNKVVKSSDDGSSMPGGQTQGYVQLQVEDCRRWWQNMSDPYSDFEGLHKAEIDPPLKSEVDWKVDEHEIF